LPSEGPMASARPSQHINQPSLSPSLSSRKPFNAVNQPDYFSRLPSNSSTPRMTPSGPVSPSVSRSPWSLSGPSLGNPGNAAGGGPTSSTAGSPRGQHHATQASQSGTAGLPQTQSSCSYTGSFNGSIAIATEHFVARSHRWFTKMEVSPDDASIIKVLYTSAI
jgi:hypothetical protein